MANSVSIPDDGSRSAGYVHGYVVGADERSRLQARVRELEQGRADLIKRLEVIEAIEPVGGDVVRAFTEVQTQVTAAIVAALAGEEP